MFRARPCLSYNNSSLAHVDTFSSLSCLKDIETISLLYIENYSGFIENKSYLVWDGMVVASMCLATRLHV